MNLYNYFSFLIILDLKRFFIIFSTIDFILNKYLSSCHRYKIKIFKLKFIIVRILIFFYNLKILFIYKKILRFKIEIAICN